MAAAPGESMGRSRRDRQGNWAGKANVIELLNDFIVELKDIESTVALHVSSRIIFQMIALLASEGTLCKLHQPPGQQRQGNFSHLEAWVWCPL